MACKTFHISKAANFHIYKGKPACFRKWVYNAGLQKKKGKLVRFPIQNADAFFSCKICGFVLICVCTWLFFLAIFRILLALFCQNFLKKYTKVELDPLLKGCHWEKCNDLDRIF